MCSNRLVFFYAAAIAFLLVPSCSKQTDSDNSGGGGLSTSETIFNNGTGSTGATGLPNNSSDDPTRVGTVTPLSPDQQADIRSSACNAWAVEPESMPAKLELVVDISSSMNQSAANTNGRAKWEVTREALAQAVTGTNGSPGLGAGTSVGMLFYPNQVVENVPTAPSDSGVCLDLGGIKPMNVLGDDVPGTWRTQLRDIILNQQTGRGTPTADAYAYALNNIVLSPEQQAVAGDAYMLLITDGIPTMYQGCYNPAGRLTDLNDAGNAVVTLIQDAYNQNNVRTFVIGSPGSETQKAWLSRAACVGQTADPGCCAGGNNICHMDLTVANDFSQALAEGLQQVATAVSGCKFEIPAQSSDGTKTVDIAKINPIVKYGDGSAELATRDNANGENCTEGFYLIDNTQMSLCKNTCDRFMADNRATLQIIFGCADTDIIDVIQ